MEEKEGEKGKKGREIEKVDSGSDRNWARSTEVKLRKRERERIKRGGKKKEWLLNPGPLK